MAQQLKKHAQPWSADVTRLLHQRACDPAPGGVSWHECGTKAQSTTSAAYFSASSVPKRHAASLPIPTTILQVQVLVQCRPMLELLLLLVTHRRKRT